MMMLQILLLLLCLTLLLPVAVFSLQVLLAWPKSRQSRAASGVRPTVAVLVPAHNESVGIAVTLNAISAQLQDGDRLLVVADNCDDDTAEQARACGAEVISRHDAQRRGKGYALDFGIRHLAAAPPDIVIVVDADCLLHGDALDRLARHSAAADRPVQALYLMHAPVDAGLKSRVAEFAWAVKNHARPLGYQRLGLPCQLMGTGMAFPWHVIRAADLASGHIVEDLKLGLDLAEKGYAPQFCPEARVTSVFPSHREGVQSQRTRWEHGHLGMLLQQGPSGLLKSLTTMNAGLLALVLDLCVPPLALLTLAVLATCGLGLALWQMSGTVLPVALALFNLAMLTAAVLIAWLRFGRNILSLGSLAYAPLYALTKIPLYCRFLFRRQADWVRSRRD
jgi:cellulose synthase/poly-beta-1,6-N-acetylglucosamine synthase-like glycosyltransferase